jgi:hypothetical protein
MNSISGNIAESLLHPPDPLQKDHILLMRVEFTKPGEIRASTFAVRT